MDYMAADRGLALSSNDYNDALSLNNPIIKFMESPATSKIRSQLEWLTPRIQ